MRGASAPKDDVRYGGRHGVPRAQPYELLLEAASERAPGEHPLKALDKGFLSS